MLNLFRKYRIKSDCTLVGDLFIFPSTYYYIVERKWLTLFWKLKIPYDDIYEDPNKPGFVKTFKNYFDAVKYINVNLNYKYDI